MKLIDWLVSKWIAGCTHRPHDVAYDIMEGDGDTSVRYCNRCGAVRRQHERERESEEFRARYGIRRVDMADLLSAGICISFTEIPRETTTRGGRHVEHGMALALGKRTIVVGWRENVFHCLPQVEFFEQWSDALSLIADAAKNREGGEHG